MRARRISLAAARIVLLILLFAHAVDAASPAKKADPLCVRVGLLSYGQAIRQVTLTASSGLLVLTVNDIPYKGAPSQSLVLEPGENGIALRGPSGASVIPCSVVSVTAAETGASVGIQTSAGSIRYYGGAVQVSVSNGVLEPVNIVELEDYVAGVLPAEMPESYPLEALKAQAIAVRTYALKNQGKHASAGFDVCDTDNCQSYRGVPVRKPRCAQAATETAGIVATYRNELAHVLYCADGGGATQDYSETHPNSAIPYLQSAKDPQDVPHGSWEKSYTLSELGAKMAQAGVKGAESVRQYRVAKVGSSGRVLSVEMISGTGSAFAAGTRLRSILGERILKSTLFTIEQSADGVVTFRGKGYGHGYGLCQMGSKGLAQPPYNYTCSQILAHYFPGTALASVFNLGSPIARQEPIQAASANAPPLPKKVEVAPAPPSRSEPARASGDGLTFQVRLKAPDRL